MPIWVDADACPLPIKEILYRAAERNEVNRKQLEAALAETDPAVPAPENSFTKT